MSHPLDGCREKIKRANEHIFQIHHDVFVGGKVPAPDNPVLTQYDPETSSLIFTCQGPVPILPLSFSILSGEVTYQLRSALDHLVYQLIVVKTKQPPTFPSAFPIVGKGKMTKRGWRSASDEYVAQTSRLEQDISSAAETIIKGLQPFHRGASYDEDPLWLLHELNNTDKHRLLLLTVHSLTLCKFTVTGRDKTIEVTFPQRVRFEDNAEIGRWPADQSFGEPDVSMNARLSVDIAFKEILGRKDESVIPCLTQLANYVQGIVESFAPEFG